jgi:hypothetical protein
MSKRQRAHQVRAAHDATRGKPCSIEAVKQRARTQQQRVLHASPLETKLADMLRERGIHTVPQQAIGTYNCDLGASPVAVEVRAAYWDCINSDRFRNRIRNILDAGWSVLIVLINKRKPLTPIIADDAAAYIKRLRGQPPVISQYRVVWGTPEVTTSGRADDDQLALKYPFRSRRDPVTGRYESIPR